MKENYAIIILLITSISIFAQPTLNLANFPTSYNAFSASVLISQEPPVNGWVGNEGANQIWDFSSFEYSLCCTDGAFIDLVPLASTLHAGVFPTANYCYRISTDNGTQYEYYKLTPSAFELLGGFDFGIYTNSPPLSFFQFPYEFGAQIINFDNVISSYDAYGTLITSSGTYPNVIRRKTIYADDNSYEFYKWYNTDPYYILAEAQVYLDKLEGFRLYTTTVSGSMGIDGNIKEAALSVSPNPTKSILNLKIANNLLVDKIIISDLSGKVIAEKTENLGSIDVQNLANGVYILSAYSGKEKFQTKFLKE